MPPRMVSTCFTMADAPPVALTVNPAELSTPIRTVRSAVTPEKSSVSLPSPVLLPATSLMVSLPQPAPKR